MRLVDAAGAPGSRRRSAPAPIDVEAAKANLRAMRYAFYQQWKEFFTLGGVMNPFFSSVGPAAGIGHIVGRSGNDVAISYVFIGAALMTMWNMGVFRTGWTLGLEHVRGTLELMITTQTPLFAIMLGKAAAITASLSITGVTTFLIVLLFARQVPPVASPVYLLVSVLLAVIALVSMSFVFAPFSFLSGARGGFFNAIMPLGSVVGGFLYSVEVLPASLEALAQLMPTAWAMDAVVLSVHGNPSLAALAKDWAIAILLSAVFLLVTSLLFKQAEYRVRVSGSIQAL